MPIDSSIALQVRPFDLPNPLAQYAQFSQIQNAQNQNALAQYQLSSAKRNDESANALADAYRGAVNPDGSINRGLLMSRLSQGAAAGQIPAVQKNLLESDKALASLSKDQMETMQKALSVSGGALATIAQNPTRDNAARTVSELVRIGLPGADKMFASIPQNDADVAAWVKLHSGTTEHSLKVLEALAPKIDYLNTGDALTPRNKNTLAGPATSVGGAQSVPVNMTPGERATDVRDRAKMAFEGIPVGGSGGGGVSVPPAAGGGGGGGGTATVVAGLSPKGQQAVMQKFQEGRAGSAVEYDKSLNERVAQAGDLNMRTQEINRALQDFQTGGGKEARTKLAQYAQAIPGIPPELVNRIAGGDISAAQEFQKLQVTNAMEQLRLAMGGTGRITQSEFAAFREANPNLNLDPNAIQKIMDFTTKMYRISREEQQAFGKWNAEGKNPADFRANWDQQMEAKGYTQPDLQAKPKGSTAASGWGIKRIN